MLRKTVFVMNACLVGFLLLTSLQFSAHTTWNNSCLNVVVFSRMDKVELCRYSLLNNSTFNLTLERGNDGSMECLVESMGTELKLHNWTDKTQCSVSTFNGTFSLSLINLKGKHSGNYACRLKKIFPPPFSNSIINRTLLYVNDFAEEPPACNILSFVETWFLIGVSLFLLACFILVLFISSKRKHCRECVARNMQLTEHNGEYMHMASVPLPKYIAH
ncbi:cytotoxic T-lymphocyte protein 4-like [Hyla sarda]|uniref:cytotoxic T-lymphocyte protein 4-like n=1 Tax=Hyla sarda TaxID=327740 RepID=UPI0024C274C7|nr:cytotoxic T-lymphocyte protein 4-like [Hyla sarda]